MIGKKGPPNHVPFRVNCIRAVYLKKRISERLYQQSESRVEESNALCVYEKIIGLIAAIQSVLFLTHYLLYETWIFSPAGSETPGAFWIKLVLGSLSVSFVAASLLAFRYTNTALRAFYKIAAVWMGLVSFLFLAAVSSWIIFGVARLAGLDMNFHRCVELLFGLPFCWTVWGIQRKLDADYANHRAAREPTAGVARAKSCAD